MLHYFTTLINTKLNNKRGEFGMSALLGVVSTMIVTAFIVLPGMRGFADNVIVGLDTWWESMSSSIFPLS